MGTATSSSKISRLTILWVKLHESGVANAPPALQARIRTINSKTLRDGFSAHLLTLIYLCLGAWKLATLNILLSTITFAVLALNALGFYRASRIFLGLSFSLSIAVVNFSVGNGVGAELFVFAGIASIFANFALDELNDILFCLGATFALTLGSHLLASRHIPWIVVPHDWMHFLRVCVWIFACGLLLSQLATFFMATKKAKDDLAKSEKMQRALFDQAATGLTVVSTEGVFLRANPELCRILGYTERELLGQKVSDLTIDDDREKTRADIKRLMSGEVESLTKIKTYVHKAGHSIPANLQTRVLRHADGSPLYLISAVQDLTELKLTEQKLRESSKMASLGEMAGSIAHEINTPLAIMSLAAESLLTSEGDAPVSRDDVNRSAQAIIDTADRVARIIKGLKSVSRNADGDPLETLSLQSLVEDTLSLTRDRLKQREIKLQFGTLDSANVLCRAPQFTQVLMNVLNNAIDAMDDIERGKRWIKIEAKRSGHFVSLSVSDSRSGVPLELQNRIYDPFFTTKPVGKGTGLGLSISKGLMEAQRGRLLLDRLASPTRFVLELRQDEGQSDFLAA